MWKFFGNCIWNVYVITALPIKESSDVKVESSEIFRSSTWYSVMHGWTWVQDTLTVLLPRVTLKSCKFKSKSSAENGVINVSL